MFHIWTTFEQPSHILFIELCLLVILIIDLCSVLSVIRHMSHVRDFFLCKMYVVAFLTEARMIFMSVFFLGCMCYTGSYIKHFSYSLSPAVFSKRFLLLTFWLNSVQYKIPCYDKTKKCVFFPFLYCFNDEINNVQLQLNTFMAYGAKKKQTTFFS